MTRNCCFCSSSTLLEGKHRSRSRIDAHEYKIWQRAEIGKSWVGNIDKLRVAPSGRSTGSREKMFVAVSCVGFVGEKGMEHKRWWLRKLNRESWNTYRIQLVDPSSRSSQRYRLQNDALSSNRQYVYRRSHYSSLDRAFRKHHAYRLHCLGRESITDCDQLANATDTELCHATKAKLNHERSVQVSTSTAATTTTATTTSSSSSSTTTTTTTNHIDSDNELRNESNSTNKSNNFDKTSTRLVDLKQEIVNEKKKDVALALEQKWNLWVAAIKLPLFSVAILPLAVGASLAFGSTGVFFKERFMKLCCGSICIILWLNLSNDGYDADTGVDVNKAESVVNLTNNRDGVLLFAWLFFAIGVGLITHALITIPLSSSYAATVSASVSAPSNLLSPFRLLFSVVSQRGAYCLALLCAAISCGWAYQCPPLRLSYRGYGELLCFLAFGPLATTAFSLAFGGGDVEFGANFAASILIGWSTTVILFCSHFHQREGDLASGKRSPIVRFGKKSMSNILNVALVGFYATVVAFVGCGFLAMEHFIVYPISLVPAIRLIRFVNERVEAEDDMDLKVAKFRAIEWHISQALMLVFGFVFTFV